MRLKSPSYLLLSNTICEGIWHYDLSCSVSKKKCNFWVRNLIETYYWLPTISLTKNDWTRSSSESNRACIYPTSFPIMKEQYLTLPWKTGRCGKPCLVSSTGLVPSTIGGRNSHELSIFFWQSLLANGMAEGELCAPRILEAIVWQCCTRWFDVWVKTWYHTSKWQLLKRKQCACLDFLKRGLLSKYSIISKLIMVKTHLLVLLFNEKTIAGELVYWWRVSHRRNKNLSNHW